MYPAIDVNRSGTRKEELLMHPDELEKVRVLRRVLADMHPVEAMEMLVNRSKKTKSNAGVPALDEPGLRLGAEVLNLQAHSLQRVGLLHSYYFSIRSSE